VLNTFVNKLKNSRFFNHFIISFTVLIITILIYTTFHIYTITLEETKYSHQEKQLELAKSAASGISYYLGYLNQELEYFSNNSYSSDYFSEFYQSKVKREILKTVFEVDEISNTIFSFGKQIPDNIGLAIKEIILEKPNSAIGIPIYSDVYTTIDNQDSDSLFFVMLIQNRKNVRDKGITYLGYLISFDWLIKNFIEPLKLSENDFAWILDNKGRLLYHPHHEEMLFRSIVDIDKNCMECHASFDVQNRMILKKTSLDEYHIIGEPKKIMAYVSIELNGNSWILAISTYLPSVISSARDNFVMFFLLSGIVIILIILMGVALYSINIKRIKAEESERFLVQSRTFQEKINHAAKLASIGELVDNVAHEINTPTGIISAETDVLLLQNCNPKNCCEELDIIKDQTRRIRNYTRSLLNYSKRMPFLQDINDINELLDECLFLLSPRIRANQIKVTKNIPVTIPKFMFDKGRIEQVINNILNNAIDAVRDDREIKISILFNDENTNGTNNVEIAISDKGVGISKENIEKVFEPFFSTKSAEQGTGLGLSISNAIIKRHDGNILVKSNKIEGTTFSIHLPFINDPEV